MISKMRKLVLTTLLLSGLTIPHAFAQSPIKGVVKSANDNRPLESATIVVKGSSSGTQSNAQGQFSISAKAGDQLVISSVGYDTKTVSVLNSSTPLEILLAAAKSDLEDVVVVGYGTQKKVSMTSAVSQIKGADLVRRPVSNLQQALQGQAPGLTVLDRGGEPGRSAATMRIRGITTFSGNSSGNSSPLIIIDGVEQTLFNINPEDVENISILKDASSTAIYGSRAANGVVLVTTKRAKAGKVQIAYNGFYAIQQSVNQAQNMDLEPYMRYQQLAYINQGLAIPARYTDASIQTWVNSKDRYTYPLVNTWFESVLNPAPQQSHNFSFSGGSEFSRTRVSMRYMDQAGIAANHGAKIRELRMSNDMQLSKKLKFSTDLNYRYNLSNRPFAGDVFNRFFHGTLFAAPKYPNGTYGLSPQGFNPLLLTEKSGYNNIATHYIFTSGKLDYEILPDLVFSAQAAAVIDYAETKSFQNQVYNFDSINNRTYSVANNNLTESRNRSTEITYQLPAELFQENQKT